MSEVERDWNAQRLMERPRSVPSIAQFVAQIGGGMEIRFRADKTRQ